MKKVHLDVTLVILCVLLMLGSVASADVDTRHVTQEVRMAAFSLQALHDEIELDPEGIGYKNGDGTWKEDAEIVALINAQNYKIDRGSIDASLITGATTYDAYNDLLADRQEWIRWKTSAGTWVVEADMKLQLSGRTLTANGVAGTGDNGGSFWSIAEEDVMAPRMLALIEIDGSRAQVLWGESMTISISQVADAANL